MPVELVEIEKAHGNGNDHILIPDFDNQIVLTPELVIGLANRHTGIGADGVIRMVRSSNGADFFMDYWNSDGSLAEMCGMGISCMADSIRSRNLNQSNNLTIETRAGIKEVELLGERRVKVNMGPPIFNPREIPFDSPEEDAIGGRLMFPDGRSFYEVTCLSMGNPHCVLIVEDLDEIDINTLGPEVENNKLFRHKTNVEVAQVISPSLVRVKVWERGAGKTECCGTGACAVCVAGRLRFEGSTDETVVISMPGGDVETSWAGSTKVKSSVFLTTFPKSVFKVKIDLRDFQFQNS